MALHAVTIALSAFLLFLVQPIVARQIVPWFGGSAAVWTTCLVFFQLALLAGYAYADWIARRRTARTQAWVHAALLLASLAWLPIVASPALQPTDAQSPVGRILALLAATIGLPYVMLSTTGPLVQAWFVRRFPRARVYRLYALSNAASMAALIAYPPLLEPHASGLAQARGWSVGYAVFVAMAIALAWRTARMGAADAAPVAPPASGIDAMAGPADEPSPARSADPARSRVEPTLARDEPARSRIEPAPALAGQAAWLLLAALASVLLLSVTAHLTQNVASVPFLWIVPLVLYLASFILCFDGRGWYWPAWYRIGACVAAVALLGGLDHRLDASGHIERALMPLQQAMPVYALGLFVLCMFAHGELVRRKPAPAHLTRFYLMVSAGGALGGLAVGVIAPLAFDWAWELAIALVVAPAIVAVIGRPIERAAGVAATAGGIALALAYVAHVHEDALETSRNFYGTLRVKASAPDSDPNAKWRLLHGVITHGEQYRAAARRREPTTYYGPSSGVALAIEALRDARPDDAQRLGLVGLGVGTLTAYGRAGDAIRIYEIDPNVLEVARRRFTYLADSEASVEVVLGDARLSLEREPPQRLDLLAIDAFTSDAIPVHLLTREAAHAYRRHLRDDGVLALHISNRYLDLAGVARQLADDLGWQALRVIDDPPDGSELYRSDWVLVTANDAVIQALRDDAQASIDVPPRPRQRAWTDDFHDLFQVLK